MFRQRFLGDDAIVVACPRLRRGTVIVMLSKGLNPGTAAAKMTSVLDISSATLSKSMTIMAGGEERLLSSAVFAADGCD